ncbi:hypothetical protein H839_16998 [Parageobacillus genomosp. 1]|uniref:Uncharacterized protein n=1 Tax=Parageobacillus genomosp. 1 TaxID=1295642 RepID=A0ABC9VAY8_9BACL|nr:hypothetical protein H839_16998 [Parageobacillus genomosp. 1]
MGQLLAGFPHSSAGNDDDTQMRGNLLKFYVYSVKCKPLFFGSRRGVLRKNLHKRNKITKYVK